VEPLLDGRLLLLLILFLFLLALLRLLLLALRRVLLRVADLGLLRRVLRLLGLLLVLLLLLGALFRLRGLFHGLSLEGAEHGAVLAEDLDPRRLAGMDLGEPVVDQRAVRRVLSLAARRAVVEVGAAPQAPGRGRGEEARLLSGVGRELAQQRQAVEHPEAAPLGGR